MRRTNLVEKAKKMLVAELGKIEEQLRERDELERQANEIREFLGIKKGKVGGPRKAKKTPGTRLGRPPKSNGRKTRKMKRKFSPEARAALAAAAKRRWAKIKKEGGTSL